MTAGTGATTDGTTGGIGGIEIGGTTAGMTAGTGATTDGTTGGIGGIEIATIVRHDRWDRHHDRRHNRWW